MMLYRLSIANIKKSIKDYAIYFFTLILGVCIFYIFNSLDGQTAMLKVNNNRLEIIQILVEAINYLSVFVAFVLGFLIIYASRFLIKKRNKEFGIYLTLGMSKRKISTLLLMETFIIGLISLSVGLIIGILLSQITSIFIANLFEADMSKYAFVFSKPALFKTIIYFGIIYLVVMIFNTVMVNKCKLIDLIHSNKKTETIKIKNPIINIIIFIISITMLGIAYYLVTNGFSILFKHSVKIIFVPILLGIVGTTLFFYSVAGMLLRVITKCKKIYYKGLNTFIYKNINSKINTMVISISVICIMLFFTMCLLSTALTIKNYFNKELNTLAPLDVEIGVYNDEQEIDFKSVFKENNIYDEFKDFSIIKTYIDDDFDYGKSLGKTYDAVRKRYPYVDYASTVEIMSLTDYNSLSKIMNLNKINLNDNEYAIVANYENYLYDDVMSENEKLNIFGYELEPFKDKTVIGQYWIETAAVNIGFFVVPDHVVSDKEYFYEYALANYKTNSSDIQRELNNKIYNIDYHADVMFTNRLEIADYSIGISVVITFIGLYLGLVFLISSAAILALKELSDSLDDKDKYQVLRNLGTDEKMINKALFKQTLIFFLLPLLLAIVHTIFGIKFSLALLEIVGYNGLGKAIISTIILIIIVYGGYFIITYFCNKNIIKQRN